jgi:small subunit ribosomal protein S8
MFNDTISDVLTRIRNAGMVKSTTVRIPLTRLSQQLCQILEKEGYIASFQREGVTSPKGDASKDAAFLSIQLKYSGPQRKPCITNLRRISTPGLRIYTNAQDIPKVLGGMGIVIISTSQGLMTDREARYRRIGGEIVCSVW